MTESEVEILYVQVLSNLDDDEISFLHLKSVGNFIKHIRKLDNEHKIDVYNRLYKYLVYVRDSKDKITKNLPGNRNSLELFNDHIKPIGFIYTSQMDFGVQSKMWVDIINILLVCLCLWFLEIMVLNIVVAMFLFWYSRKQYINKKEGRFYGYGY